MTALDRLTRALVREQAERWRHLQAWGRVLPCAKLAAPKESRLGIARYSGGCEVNMRPGTSLAGACSTILHEYAHLAAGTGVHHGPAWRERFAAGVREATGREVSSDAIEAVMDEQARAAVRAWLLERT